MCFFILNNFRGGLELNKHQREWKSFNVFAWEWVLTQTGTQECPHIMCPLQRYSVLGSPVSPSQFSFKVSDSIVEDREGQRRRCENIPISLQPNALWRQKLEGSFQCQVMRVDYLIVQLVTLVTKLSELSRLMLIIDESLLWLRMQVIITKYYMRKRCYSDKWSKFYIYQKSTCSNDRSGPWHWLNAGLQREGQIEISGCRLQLENTGRIVKWTSECWLLWSELYCSEFISKPDSRSGCNWKFTCLQSKNA